ncbi:udp-galactose/udp-glucose transporter 3 [Quercus suber]|uniref:Udp-galactose/udp-glucose transporter 3 n=1 Tax=Quercus suber TaxID=58331 RepID=A0AAW0KLP6_QUESU
MEIHGDGLRRVLVLAFCVAGIWSAYIYQGFLQETLSTKRFGPDEKRFEHLSFLNLAQNVVCLIWSFIMIKLWSSGSNGGAPWWMYWSAGITNTIGPAMGIEALKYISYPAQACTGKILKNDSRKMQSPSSKPLALVLMLMGALVYGIRYTVPEYLCTFLVAGGVSTFALLKPKTRREILLEYVKNVQPEFMEMFVNRAPQQVVDAMRQTVTNMIGTLPPQFFAVTVTTTSSKTIGKLAQPNAPLGYLLCFLNLTFDGFTNATQDSITKRYPKTSAWDIMLGMNLWGTIYNMIYMFGWPHASGFEAVQFCKQHPEAAWDIFLYCLCGAVGQNFIFLTISRFGSLANTHHHNP